MAEIKPFRGYRYDSSVAGDIGKLIAPPYDVIDDATREGLYRQSDYNVARITRADRDESDPSSSPYGAAAALFNEWREAGIVRYDEQPGFYVYEQYFEVQERRMSRTGLIGLTRLRKPGDGVLPHENTHLGPRQDRLQLLRAAHVQFGQVFGLYPDPEGVVDDILERVKRERPVIQATDIAGHLHRLWAITDSETIAHIQNLMADKDILIADGHHRYETALAYASERPDCQGAQYRMMTLVNMSNVGLVVLPIHRMIAGLDAFDPKAFLNALRRAFEVRAYPGDSAVARDAVLKKIRRSQAGGKQAFGLYLGNGNYYTLVLKHSELMDDLGDASPALRALDVSVLQHLVFAKILGLTSEQLKEQHKLEYVSDFLYAIQAAADSVKDGRAQALFLLNPTRVQEVQSIAQNRERMPQKSTFFYPKVFTGLVFYDVDS